jgi:hypothetical protein
LDKSKNILMIVAVIVIIYMIVVFGKDLVNGIEGIFGIKTDPVSAAASNAAIAGNMSSSNPSSPFSPNLYTNNPDASTLDYQTLQDMASKIKGSVSLLPNWISPADGPTGLANIKRCNNQVDVSNLVVVFQQLYSADLYDFMAANYTPVITQQILNFVNALPTT